MCVVESLDNFICRKEVPDSIYHISPIIRIKQVLSRMEFRST